MTSFQLPRQTKTHKIGTPRRSPSKSFMSNLLKMGSLVWPRMLYMPLGYIQWYDPQPWSVYNLDGKKDQAYHSAKIWQQPFREFFLSHWRLSAGPGFFMYSTMENSDRRYCSQAWGLMVFLLALIVLAIYWKTGCPIVSSKFVHSSNSVFYSSHQIINQKIQKVVEPLHIHLQNNQGSSGRLPKYAD